ncbi:unnamed protein product [Closterium sp. NIES-65]|nr:unnamed protein product [Closterium sp. NIES-65]
MCFCHVSSAVSSFHICSLLSCAISSFGITLHVSSSADISRVAVLPAALPPLHGSPAAGAAAARGRNGQLLALLQRGDVADRFGLGGWMGLGWWVYGFGWVPLACPVTFMPLPCPSCLVSLLPRVPLASCPSCLVSLLPSLASTLSPVLAHLYCGGSPLLWWLTSTVVAHLYCGDSPLLWLIIILGSLFFFLVCSFIVVSRVPSPELYPPLLHLPPPLHHTLRPLPHTLPLLIPPHRSRVLHPPHPRLSLLFLSHPRHRPLSSPSTTHSNPSSRLPCLLSLLPHLLPCPHPFPLPPPPHPSRPPLFAPPRPPASFPILLPHPPPLSLLQTHLNRTRLLRRLTHQAGHKQQQQPPLVAKSPCLKHLLLLIRLPPATHRAAYYGSPDVGDSPAGDSPAGDSPAGDSPAGDSPAGDSPAGDSPAGNSPAGDSPAGDSPAGDSPAGDSPAEDSPAGDSPAAAPVSGGGREETAEGGGRERANGGLDGEGGSEEEGREGVGREEASRAHVGWQVAVARVMHTLNLLQPFKAQAGGRMVGGAGGDVGGEVNQVAVGGF